MTVSFAEFDMFRRYSSMLWSAALSKSGDQYLMNLLLFYVVDDAESILVGMAVHGIISGMEDLEAPLLPPQ